MLPGIQTTTFWQAVTSIQKTWENLAHWTVVGWNWVNDTSAPVSIFQMRTFFLGFAEPDITYRESGEKPHSKFTTCFKNCTAYSPPLADPETSLGLKLPYSLRTMLPLKASSSMIILSLVPRRMYLPLGENFIDFISLVSFSIVKVWNGLSL